MATRKLARLDEGADLRIRPAAPGQVAVAAEILEEAIRWSLDRGVGSWDEGTFRAGNAEGSGRRILVEAMGRGDLHLAWRAGRAVATVTLQWSDQVFWPGSPDDAGYVHRLAVRSAEHGRGTGMALLEWAEERARSRGRRWLRLDCLAENARVRGYYEAAGFRHRGDVEVTGRMFSLYEKAV